MSGLVRLLPALVAGGVPTAGVVTGVGELATLLITELVTGTAEEVTDAAGVTTASTGDVTGLTTAEMEIGGGGRVEGEGEGVAVTTGVTT